MPRECITAAGSRLFTDAIHALWLEALARRKLPGEATAPDSIAAKNDEVRRQARRRMLRRYCPDGVLSSGIKDRSQVVDSSAARAFPRPAISAVMPMANVHSQPISQAP